MQQTIPHYNNPPQPYINSTGRNVLECLSPDTILVLLSLSLSIYKKMLMKPKVPVPDSNHCATGLNQFVGSFVIDLPCILTDYKTLFVNDIYSLIDFSDNGGIVERAVRFFDAYLSGYIITIVVLDLESGELIKRKHRLNNNVLPCNWALMDTDYLNPKSRKDDLEFDF
jgi:hypothetical protein